MTAILPYDFGAGEIYLIPTSGTNLTPVHVGAHQGMTLDFKADIKTLHGSKAYALAAAAGKRETTVTFKSAEINIVKWNAILFGGTTSAGQVQAAQNEAATVPATPYTVTPANQTKFYQDLGVTYQATGQSFKLTASVAPALAGTYHLNASNKYVFSSAETVATPVYLNYLWSDNTAGTTLTITNPQMGYTPNLQIVFTTILNGQVMTGKFNQAVGGSIKIETKIDDWMMGDFNLTCFCDATGTLCTLSTTAS